MFNKSVVQKVERLYVPIKRYAHKIWYKKWNGSMKEKLE